MIVYPVHLQNARPSMGYVSSGTNIRPRRAGFPVQIEVAMYGSVVADRLGLGPSPFRAACFALFSIPQVLQLAGHGAGALSGIPLLITVPAGRNFRHRRYLTSVRRIDLPLWFIPLYDL